MLEHIEERFRDITPQGDFCSLRFVRERSEVLSVRQNIVQPPAAVLWRRPPQPISGGP